MLHLRVISPAHRTGEAVGYLDSATGVTNLVVMTGAARRPEGDVLMFDMAREAANDVIARLREMGLDEEGSIAGESVDLALSEVAERAEAEAPGHPDDAVVWEALAQRVAEDSRMTWAYFVFFIIATQISAIAVQANSPVLLVGAMVLGPEFGAIAGVSFGLLRRDLALATRAVRALVLGFTAAIFVTFACALLARGFGWIDPQTFRPIPEIEFIVKPDRWSFIVAVLAGAAGVLSVTAGKSSALVGVFISVTTVPAAGYAALAIALARWSDVAGSVAQLGVNVLGMIIAGTVTLFVQRHLWSRFNRSRPTPLGSDLVRQTRPGG